MKSVTSPAGSATLQKIERQAIRLTPAQYQSAMAGAGGKLMRDAVRKQHE